MTIPEKPKLVKKIHLCGDCQQNIALCPWLHEGKPVESWTAKRTYIKKNVGHTAGYCVTACPLYIPLSAERLEEQARQEREDAEELRKEQDRRRNRTFFW